MVKAAAARGWIDEDADDARDPDLDPPGRRRHHPHLPREGLRPAGPERGPCTIRGPDRRGGERRHDPIRGAVRAREGGHPGGVSSPVRAFKAVGGHAPLRGPRRGPALLGRGRPRLRRLRRLLGADDPRPRPPAVLAAVREAAARGTSFGAPCALEVELAERVVRHVPSVEKVRFVSSGTEATMSALRVARGFTGRRKILKFDGCYHGHADSLLVAAGSGVATLGIPGSPGVPEGTVADTLVAPFNDVAAVERGRRRPRPRPRRRHRRAGVRQHGHGRAEARLPRGAARDHARRAGPS